MCAGDTSRRAGHGRSRAQDDIAGCRATSSVRSVTWGTIVTLVAAAYIDHAAHHGRYRAFQ